jgi:hypothetical protein
LCKGSGLHEFDANSGPVGDLLDRCSFLVSEIAGRLIGYTDGLSRHEALR